MDGEQYPAPGRSERGRTVRVPQRRGGKALPSPGRKWPGGPRRYRAGARARPPLSPARIQVGPRTVQFALSHGGSGRFSCGLEALRVDLLYWKAGWPAGWSGWISTRYGPASAGTGSPFMTAETPWRMGRDAGGGCAGLQAGPRDVPCPSAGAGGRPYDGALPP